MSGSLLFDALRAAADRGVRVRLLLDDNNTAGLDDVLAALDAHPNIEVRLFNPFAHARLARAGLSDRLLAPQPAHAQQVVHRRQPGRRSSAAATSATNTSAPAGDVLFVDLDVLAVGPVVREVSQDFDRYWASASAYPARRVLPPAGAGRARAARGSAAPTRARSGRRYLDALAQLALRARAAGAPAAVRVGADAHGQRRPGQGARTRERPTTSCGPGSSGSSATPTRELELVSPYFVPDAAGVDYFAALARRGVKVTVLTNSLEATDVPAVHAGYAKRRKPLLEAGVELYEMKRTSAHAPHDRERGRQGSSSRLQPARQDLRRRPLDRSSSARSISIRARPASTPSSASSSTSPATGAGDCRCVRRQHSGRGLPGALGADGALQWVEERRTARRSCTTRSRARASGCALGVSRAVAAADRMAALSAGRAGQSTLSLDSNQRMRGRLAPAGRQLRLSYTCGNLTTRQWL